ncbi:MAG: hypothetical protein CR982_03305 [Candidatus Cloacimonadota bacterium]|nr:MAG: hypothetical protein CR982_03305 [Candidatus Cloacimonadota bacterium]PIE78812.1 MAG: hypothetical protein CSA15_05760 [Candidatus Delongbacteria bacterium]
MSEHIQFIFDKDMIFCYIKLIGDFNSISERYVKNRLKENRIVYGVSEQTIKDLFEKNEDLFKSGKKIMIARGTPPKKGKNGYIEYLISDDMNLKEKNKGLIDFYDIGVVKSVQKDENLVRIHPPLNGSVGKNVKGEIIPGRMGDKIKLKDIALDGVVIKGEYACAKRDGRYRRFPTGKVGVLEEVFIDSDLNFSVGNIDTTATINVKGDVRARFNVSTTADISVEGSVEDAEIFAGEALVCKSGILTGERPIYAEIIKAKYISNRKNILCKNIYVEDMISSSIIVVKGFLEAKKLTGGLTQVVDGFRVEELGNKSYHKTKIDVGFQEEDLMEMAKLFSDMKRKHMEVKNVLREIDTIRVAIKDIIEKEESLRVTGKEILAYKMSKERERKEDYIEDISKKLKIFKRQYSDFKSKYDKMLKSRNNPNKPMIILGTLYPNVTITLNTKLFYTTKSTMKNVEFRINEEGELQPFQYKGRLESFEENQ